MQGVAGLFAQLPKPRHAATKESNRILIPHTLTKRKPPPKPTQPVKKPETTSKKTSNVTSLVTGYDDNDDDEEEDGEEDSSFFSLDKKDVIKPSVPESTTTSLKSTQSSQDSRTKLEHVAPNETKQSQEKQITKPVASSSEHEPQDKQLESSTTSATESGTSDAPLAFSNPSQDAPLSFKPGTTPVYGSTGSIGSGDSDAPLSFRAGSQQQYGYYQQAGGSGYATGQYAGDYSYPYGAYNQPYTGEDSEQVEDVQATTTQVSQQQQGSYMQDKEVGHVKTGCCYMVF